MEKRIKIYALIFLLALCLAVPAVNALNLAIGPGMQTTYNLGDINNNIESVTVYNAQSLGKAVAISNCDIRNINANSKSFDVVLDTSKNTASFEIRGIYMPPQVYSFTITLNYNYIEPAPEPLEPYIMASVYNTGENNLYYDYNVICMPSEGYFFAPLSFYSYGGQLPQCDLTSEQTSIQVRVWAGDDIPMYSCALSGSGGVPNFQYIQTVLSAPVYSAGTVINVTTVKDNLQDISNPVHPSQNNPVISGDFQPIGKDTIVNSPFGNLVTNGGLIFSLPHMDDPQQLRENLLNGTQNLTAPLYDAVDSVTGAVLFVPSVISGALSSVVSPLLETVDLLKNVFESLFEVINNSMNFIYYLLPTVYLLIPDAVWWCVIAVLCYFIFKWILIFVFGNDVINAYFEKGGKE